MIGTIPDVHVTGGPAPWEYITGLAGIIGVAIAIVAIAIAVRAERAVLSDRRATFELGLLVELLHHLETRYEFNNVLLAFEPAELTHLREYRRHATFDNAERLFAAAREDVHLAIKMRTRDSKRKQTKAARSGR